MIEKVARQCILARKDYIPGKPIEEVQQELGITDIIKMASNENPLGASPKAIEAMIQEVRTNAFRYPVSLCTAMGEKLAAYLGVKPSQLYIDNGGDAVITMLGLTFLNPEDEVVTAELTFPAYENITTKMGSKLIKVPMTAQGGYDLQGIAAAITPRTKLVFLCNPNNPTGRFIPRDELLAFLEKLPETVLLFMDEAYYDFADDPAYPQTLPLLDRFPNLIVMRTFSKVMGLAGIRCGYCVASEEIVKAMMKAREPFPVNRIAQVGVMAALDDQEFIHKTLDNNAAGRQQFYTALEEMGLSYYPTQTNFIYVDLKRNAEEVYQAMLREGVIIRPLTSQGAPEAVRITIGLPEENTRTIQALKKVLGK